MRSENCYYARILALIKIKKPSKMAFFEGFALIYQDWFIANDLQILQGPHPFLWPCWPALKIR